jgi:hypothetical protein
MPTLSIPDRTYRHLVARAAEQNTTVDDLVIRLLSEEPVPLDTEYHAECAADTTPVPTLEEVRAVTAKLAPGSLTAALIAERDELTPSGSKHSTN